MEVKVALADPSDKGAWLLLADEVAPLFGLIPDFDAILDRKIGRNQAYRASVASKPRTLVGGLLIGGSERIHWIRWLAISLKYRRLGIGKTLLKASLGQVPGNSLVLVDTFTEGHPGAAAADSLYKSFGFEPLGVKRVDGNYRQRYVRQPVQPNE